MPFIFVQDMGSQRGRKLKDFDDFLYTIDRWEKHYKKTQHPFSPNTYSIFSDDFLYTVDR